MCGKRAITYFSLLSYVRLLALRYFVLFYNIVCVLILYVYSDYGCGIYYKFSVMYMWEIVNE